MSSIQGPVGPSITTTTTTGGGTTTTGTHDTLMTSAAINPFNQLEGVANSKNAIKLKAPITIGAYVLTLGTATNANIAQQTINQILKSNIFKLFAMGLVSQDQLKAAVTQAITDLGQNIANVENQVNSDITNLQGQISSTQNTIQSNHTQKIIDDYNKAVNDAVNTYNSAITYDQANYTSSTTPTLQDAIKQANTDYKSAIKTAVDNYNTAAGTANSANASSISSLSNQITSFNNNQTSNNQSITSINTELGDLGLSPSDLNPPLTAENYTVNPYSFSGLQTGVNNTITQSDTATTATAAPTLNPSSVPDTSTVTSANFQMYSPVENPSTFEQQNLQTVLNTLGINDNNFTFNDAYNAASALNNQQFNKTVGTKSYLPDAYISNHPVVSSFSVINAGGGSSLVDVTSPSGAAQANSAAVSKALLQALSFLGDLQTLQGPVKALSFFSKDLATTGSLLASLPALHIMGASARASADDHTAFGIAFGVSNGQAVANLIKSGVIESNVAEFFKAYFPDQDQATINKAADIATAIITQYLVSNSLAQASNDLGAPGLLGQVLGNTSPTTAKLVAQASASTPTLAATLSDTSNQLFLKSYLSNALASSTNGTLAGINALINQTINNAISTSFTTQAQLQTALTKAFSQTQLSAQEQSALINLAITVVLAEQNANQSLSSNLLNQQIAQALLAKQLANANVSDALAIAQEATKKVIDNISITNNEQYRLDLAAYLQSEGVQEDVANQVALATVVQASINNPALVNPVFVAPTALPTLSQQIHDTVYAPLSNILAPEKAQEVANSAVATFIGTPEERDQEIHANAPPSLLNLYKTSQKVLDGYGVTPTLAYNVKDAIHQTDDSLYSLNMIHEPGKMLLHSSWNSIMSAGTSRR